MSELHTKCQVRRTACR